MPKDDHLTSIIVWHHHIEVNKHVGGTGTTLFTLNKRYWLLGGRREVGKNLAKCTPCRRNNARPKPQEMAPLPRCRVHSQEVERITPIHKTGIDVAGPFKVNLEGLRHLEEIGDPASCLCLPKQQGPPHPQSPSQVQEQDHRPLPVKADGHPRSSSTSVICA